MKGAKPFEIAIPVQGLLTDRPKQLVPLDGLLSGQNMVLDPDGYYRPRAGYKPWLTGAQPSEALLGITFYVDTDGSFQYVGVGAANVWANIGGVWTSKGGGMHGAAADLVTIVPFLQPWIDGATQTILSPIICNNHDPLTVWNTSLSAAQPLTPVHAAGSGNTLAFNTTPTFAGSYPVARNWFFTVTATNTGNVTLNINGIGATAVMYISATGALAQLPANYLTPGTTYNVAFDGTEFVIGFNLTAPIARAICALNGRIVAVNVESGAVRVPAQVTWSSAFDATSWLPLSFQNMVDTDDPLIGIAKIGNNAAIVFGEQNGYLMQGVQGAPDSEAFAFTPINGYVAGPVSPLAVVPGSVSPAAGFPLTGGALYLGRDGRVWQCDGMNATPLSSAITSLIQNTIDPDAQTKIFSLYDVRMRRIWWFFQQTAQTTSSAIVLGLDPQPRFETLQAFPTLFTAATPIVLNAGVLWSDLTQPWDTYTQPWDSFGESSEIAMLAADASAVHQFGLVAGTLDNGAQIPYSFTPGLMTAGPMQDVRPESYDMFVKLAAVLELATIQFDSLAYPDDPGTTILAGALNFNDPASFSGPQVYPEMSTYSRYLRLTISGYSRTRALAFGGARVYADVLGRPSA